MTDKQILFNSLKQLKGKEFDENELLLISLALENEFDDADDEIKEMIKKLVKKVEMMLNDF